MGLFAKLFKTKQMKRSATITLIGPSKSGKTTLVRYIETGETVDSDVHTTLGIEIRRNFAEIDGWKLKAIDTGGQEIFRQTFWELAVQQADAVVFVIDATIRKESNPEMYELSMHQFEYALELLSDDVPLLLLLNKQDLESENPMGAREAFQVFNQSLFEDRTIAFLPCSAKYGNGVMDAMAWLVEQINL